jgi:NAD(P)-dependent dehydrogenase (short-subunit alcohol dehydrogenase family)
MHALADQVESDLGPIDILVCNATGMEGSRPGELLDQDPQIVVQRVQGQLMAVLVPCRAIVLGMLSRSQQRVIAISSGWSRHPGLWHRGYRQGRRQRGDRSPDQGRPEPMGVSKPTDLLLDGQKTPWDCRDESQSVGLGQNIDGVRSPILSLPFTQLMPPKPHLSLC